MYHNQCKIRNVYKNDQIMWDEIFTSVNFHIAISWVATYLTLWLAFEIMGELAASIFRENV